MQKTRNKNLFKKLNSLPISKKITVMYSVFFTVVLLIISALILTAAYFYYKNSVQNEMESLANSVAEFIKEGGSVTASSLKALKPNQYTEIRVKQNGMNGIDVSTAREIEIEDPLPGGFGDFPSDNPNFPRGRRERRERFSRETQTYSESFTEDFTEETTSFVPRRRMPENGTVRRNEGNTPFDNIRIEDIGDRGFYNRTINNNPYIIINRETFYDGSVYNIVIYRKFSHEQAVMTVFITVFVVLNILAAIVSYMGAKYLSNAMLKPISDITKAAEEISIYDLKKRIAEPETEDEIKKLVTTFNGMIERLQVSFDKQTRFVSDASHELRTPIAVIQGYINLIDRWGKSDPDVLNESIDSIKYETEHMGVLINQLLFLARAENDTLKSNFETISLNETAKEVAKEVEISDEEATVSVTENGIVEIFADSHLTKQLMWIFIQNALKYNGGKPKKIEMEVGMTDEGPYFSVKDYGMGMTKETAEHVFDRFFREDESRNKSIEGNGLGLSIGKLIADKHNAKITVESEIDKYSKFTVTYTKKEA